LVTGTGRVNAAVATASTHVVQCFLGNGKQMRLELAFLFACIGLKNVVAVFKISTVAITDSQRGTGLNGFNATCGPDEHSYDSR
jgi:hypothetical protein